MPYSKILVLRVYVSSSQILAVGLTVTAFLFSICLIVKERYYLLPTVPSRGHGVVLLVFWTLIFINENLSFVNMRHEDWWFHLTSLKDKIEMSLFVLRYVACLLIFVIGLKAPGIVTYEPNYQDISNDEVSMYLCVENTFFHGFVIGLKWGITHVCIVM